ncbi:CidA/LrgA family protein [Lutibaculum baratangense]|uniref:Antiholin-like protein LrgA n=1 Tax=Lutibaculum baratangense AMV1 TaxID=631454 RepID=V4RL90_9HYPH|nr:CidA/LrgA family protein [Lutibaculum baratangense]ESR26821.1 Antiholin-like protein LrgA [Lutibaculum baratangense AMV1]
MLRSFLVLVLFQFTGEALAIFFPLPVPGPVLGLALLAVLGAVVPGLLDEVAKAADMLLANLSLLFVPAGVGILQHLDLLRAEIVPLVAVLVLSTGVTLAVTALVFVGVSRLTGHGEEA